MLSHRLIAGLGVDLHDAPSVPLIVQHRPLHTHLTNKSYSTKNTAASASTTPPDSAPVNVKVDSSTDSKPQDSVCGNNNNPTKKPCTNKNTLTQNPVPGPCFTSTPVSCISVHTQQQQQPDPSVWLEEYETAVDTQTDTQMHDMQKTLAKLQNKTYADSFLGQMEKVDDLKQIEVLKVRIQKMKQSSEVRTTQINDVNHEKCVHCGSVGAVHINVHRCTKHCMVCHRESVADHFHETTGTVLTTTNPGRYTRRGRFILTLNKVQAKQPVKLPPTLLGEVKKYFSDTFGVSQPADIMFDKLKPALKALGYNNKSKKGDYTDHLVSIFCQLTGTDPPRLSIAKTQVLIDDFDTLDPHFEPACEEVGVKRKNWLSYPTTIYQLCSRHKYHEMKKWLKVVGGHVALRDQQKVMKRMFERSGWAYEEIKPPPKPPGGGSSSKSKRKRKVCAVTRSMVARSDKDGGSGVDDIAVCGQSSRMYTDRHNDQHKARDGDSTTKRRRSDVSRCTRPTASKSTNSAGGDKSGSSTTKAEKNGGRNTDSDEDDEDMYNMGCMMDMDSFVQCHSHLLHDPIEVIRIDHHILSTDEEEEEEEKDEEDEEEEEDAPS